MSGEDRRELIYSRLKARVLIFGLGQSGKALSLDMLLLPRLRLSIIGLPCPCGVSLEFSRDLLLDPSSTLVLTLS